eukprot:6128626-Prymnesium_polylepis.3
MRWVSCECACFRARRDDDLRPALCTPRSIASASVRFDAPPSAALPRWDGLGLEQLAEHGFKRAAMPADLGHHRQPEFCECDDGHEQPWRARRLQPLRHALDHLQLQVL